MNTDGDTSITPDTDRGYAVTLVLRSSNGHHLQPPLALPDGITAEVAGPEVVLTLPIRAPKAATALATAQATALDLMMTLASTFNGFEFVVDERQRTRRTDAVYQAEGPPPPFDVAEGVVTEAGAEMLDPTGERRRMGEVVTNRADAVVTHHPLRMYDGSAADEHGPSASAPGCACFTQHKTAATRSSSSR